MRIPAIVPSDITVIAAKNEQATWDFSGFGCQCEVDTLGIGGADYSLKGFDDILRVERKEVNDFIASLTSGRDRFERQLKYMRQFPWRVVIVEWPSFPGLIEELEKWPSQRDSGIRSRADANSIRGSTLHLSRRWCPIVFAGDREQARDYAWDFMYGVAKDFALKAKALGFLK